jgi:hypothetical protein
MALLSLGPQGDRRRQGKTWRLIAATAAPFPPLGRASACEAQRTLVERAQRVGVTVSPSRSDPRSGFSWPAIRRFRSGNAYSVNFGLVKDWVRSISGGGGPCGAGWRTGWRWIQRARRAWRETDAIEDGARGVGRMDGGQDAQRSARGGALEDVDGEHPPPQIGPGVAARDAAAAGGGCGRGRGWAVI